MADDPNGPPSNKNLDAFTNIARTVTAVERSAALLEQHIGNIAKKGEDVSKVLKNAGSDLKTMVALSESVEEAIKGMREQSKKFQQTVMKTKTWEDQKKVIVAMAQGFKQMQKEFGTIPKMSKVAERGFYDCVTALKQMKGKTGAMGQDLIASQKTLKGLTSDFDHLAKTVKGIEFGHMHRQLIGISKVLSTAGLTKGKTAMYASQGAEMASKMRELRKSRLDENKVEYMSKRKDVLSSVESKYGSNAADPARAEALRKAMGVSWVRRKGFAKAEAGGSGAQEQFGQHGTGIGGYAMSSAAGMVETGVGSMAGALSKIAPIIAILDILRMAFDKVVEQNKEMEQSLGKGGLFSSKPGGAGFMQARTALTPGGAGYTQMGLSFERNLKMAQAVVEGGYNIAELVTGERGKGRAGEGYMPGSIGQMQQVAVGAGRVAGFGDAEGIQQIVKMLGQYRMTIQTSGDFFIQVTKDSKAAGLSTAKYIDILDGVNSHFDRMNKSMSQSINILAMLGRTGAVAGDSLQTMMDFFSQNPKTTFDNIAPKTFTAQQMTPGMRKAIKQGHAFAVAASIESANTALADIPGIGQLMGGSELAGKGMGGANSYLTEIQSKIGRSDANPTAKKTAREAVQAVRDSVNRMLGQSRGGAMGYATGEMTFGSDLVNTMADNITQMVSAGRLSGGGLKGMMTGQLGTNQQAAMSSILQSVYGQGEFSKNLNAFQQSQRLAAADRIQSTQGSPEGAKGLVKELLKLPGFRTEYKTKGYTMSIEEAQKDSVKFLKDNADALNEMVSYLDTTTTYQVAQAGVGSKVKAGDRLQAEQMGKVIGMQTQSTADIIANAFSTWFNDIINLLGKLTAWVVKPNEKDAAQAKAIFADQNLSAASVKAQQMMGDKMGSLRSEMASSKLTPEEFAAAQSEYDALGKKINKLTLYQNDDVRKTASLGDAKEYRDDILGAIHNPDHAKVQDDQADQLWRKIRKVPGVTGFVGSDEMVPNSAMGAVMQIPGVADALKSGMLTQKATDKGVQITVNQYYNADWNYPDPANTAAGTQGSSSEQSPGKK